ncbi:MAG: AMP-binding protein [Thiotrichaceae bacterium]|nr:AMP-binding protein [Thiotrichaceae bacterium]
MKRIHETAASSPNKIALQNNTISLSYQDLIKEIKAAGIALELKKGENQQTFALLLDNHPAWAVLDLALLSNKQCAVPLPKFFSIEQLKHALLDSRSEYLIFDDSQINTQLIDELNGRICRTDSITIAGKKLNIVCLNNNSVILDKTQMCNEKIVKITYTSGTTDKPKGVLLSEQVIISKVAALSFASEANADEVALSILPLSTLLENIGGLYVPLYCGARSILLSPETTGLSGSSQIDQDKLLSSIQTYKPTAFVIIPQLLLLLVNAVAKGYQLPDSIRFIAMGGAPVSGTILDLAEQLKIPVYEGYGLSEAVSVVSVNNPSEKRIGSVGKVLTAHRVKISGEGEILVKDGLFSGYLGQKDNNKDDYYATGDIGQLDKDGFLYITGRKKNIINTSFGRNISPEWIEKELDAIAMIAQCVVYGHAKPYLVAIIVPGVVPAAGNTIDDTTLSELRKSLDKLNGQLPDYARVMDFILADEPFTIQNKQLTGTGRPRRLAIYQAYEHQLEQSYKGLSLNSKLLNGELCE